MPRRPLPGDSDMPRVQSPGWGASERLAVSPGREEDGYFHMPAGQSGHPLSPFFSAGHEAWVEGLPMPLLPGPAENLLELVPQVD
jgi:penicillin amidase